MEDLERMQDAIRAFDDHWVLEPLIGIPITVTIGAEECKVRVTLFQEDPEACTFRGAAKDIEQRNPTKISEPNWGTAIPGGMTRPNAAGDGGSMDNPAAYLQSHVSPPGIIRGGSRQTALDNATRTAGSRGGALVLE